VGRMNAMDLRGTISIRPIRVALMGLLFAICPVGRTDAQVDAIDQLVVMIRGAIGEAPTAGAGIIIGTDNDRFYVVTANHVVRRGDVYAQNLEVLPPWLVGEWVQARVLEHFDTGLDLAVVAVPEASKLGKPTFVWDAMTRPESLPQGAPVFPIGFPSGNAWFRTQLMLTVHRVNSAQIETEGTLLPGHSGGALVAQGGGIVGLVSNTDRLVGESQRIDRVVEKLREWRYPISLDWKPRVPNVVGVRLDDAQRQIEAAGLQIRFVETHATKMNPPGMVFEQFPKPDLYTKRGDSMVLKVEGDRPPSDLYTLGTMRVNPGRALDLDWQSDEPAPMDLSFQIDNDRQLWLSPLNGAAIGEVVVSPEDRNAYLCQRYGRPPESPVNVAAQTSTYCVHTTRGRYSFLSVSRVGPDLSQLDVTYSTLKAPSDP
jgi:trypsin-like peptidase/PASTA domain-containing protein